LSTKSAAFQDHAPVELAPAAARVAAETATLIRADAGLYLFIAVYTLSGLVFLRAYGAGEQAAYSIYLVYWTTLFALFFPLAAFAGDAAWIVHRFDRKRSLATKRMFSHHRLARLLSGICLLMAFMIFQGTFTSVKNGLSVWQDGFPFDKVQADIDAWLHFGVDPWRWLAFAQHDFVRIVLEWNYAAVFFTICFGALFFVATSPLAASVRTRYLVCFMLVWIVVGNLLAGLFMSAGPAFYGAVTGDEFRFAQQLEFLARGADWPNSSAAYQDYLWTLHSAGQTGFGSGISAFPSVHVALAMFNALFVWEYSRRFGLLAFAYVALILASSVYLGWHYAIDGYAAIIVTALIYTATRRMKPTDNRLPTVKAS
jgi:hypothetical protein